MRRWLMSWLLLLLFAASAYGQQIIIDKMEPPNWWCGMNKSEIQLMVYGENLSNVDVKSTSKMFSVTSVEDAENSDYCFVNIKLDEEITPGEYKLEISNGASDASINFPILKRKSDENRYRGFDQQDVIYLITPDRFSDGDPGNNTVDGYLDEYDRSNPYGRHGGDIQGIINKLDYLVDLGITTIWINPLVENDTRFSYHGYAATDFYNIDARFGSNELYREFVDQAHSRGLKVILDHVSNHMSIDHPWMNSLPQDDWINGSKESHLNAHHDKMAYTDPYTAHNTIDYLSKGWFVNSMPDLNQRNSFVANYIIQNTIWWVEYSGVDGIREDTYPYVDQEFMAEWAKAVMTEYPEFNIVGEVWTGTTAFLAPYQGNSKLIDKFNSNLPAITDFGLRDVLYGYLKGENGLYDIYKVLAKDYLYADPSNLVTFIDNHDIERIMYAADTNWTKARTALAILLTTRGIPQILYGTEIGMIGAPEHGLLRADFPGGFPGDKKNAFSENGRSENQNRVYDFIKRLLNIRKLNSCLQNGDLIHYPPGTDVYVYSRRNDKGRVIVIINGTDKGALLNTAEYGDLFQSPVYIDQLGGTEQDYSKKIILAPYDIKIIKAKY